MENSLDIPYGIYDTQSQTWLGKPGQEGPNVYRNTEIKGEKFTGEAMAKIAAAIVRSMMRLPTDSPIIEARPFDEGDNYHFKDEVEAKVSFSDVMKANGINECSQE